MANSTVLILLQVKTFQWAAKAHDHLLCH
jgi:hypothetical protein